MVSMAALAVMSAGCGPAEATDVTGQQPYAKFIGREYRIIREVDAYGIKMDPRDEQPAVILLMPRPGIAGWEVAFRKPLEKGQTFRIRGAKHRFMVFDDGTEYVVDLKDPTLAEGLEVRIAMLGGNEGGGGELNPEVYERLK
jgi:hypothetical protein